MDCDDKRIPILIKVEDELPGRGVRISSDVRPVRVDALVSTHVLQEKRPQIAIIGHHHRDNIAALIRELDVMAVEAIAVPEMVLAGRRADIYCRAMPVEKKSRRRGQRRFHKEQAY